MARRCLRDLTPTCSTLVLALGALWVMPVTTQSAAHRAIPAETRLRRCQGFLIFLEESRISLFLKSGGKPMRGCMCVTPTATARRMAGGRCAVAPSDGKASRLSSNKWPMPQCCHRLFAGVESDGGSPTSSKNSDVGSLQGRYRLASHCPIRRVALPATPAAECCSPSNVPARPGG
jgi:hypothetical protein